MGGQVGLGGWEKNEINAILNSVEVWIEVGILKQTFFSPIMTPHPTLTQPTTHPWDYLGGNTKRGEGGLIKVKNKLTLKFVLGDLKHF